MGKIYQAKMDAVTTLLWLGMICLPIYMITYGILINDYVMIALGLIINSLGSLFIVWPLMNAFYQLEEDGLVVRYWGVKTFPYEEIKAAKKVSGMHRFALSGLGYYCTNFGPRVLVDTKKKDFIISPDKPDEFVKELNERAKLITQIYRMAKQ
ncbi:MAG: hypothetical protein QXO69_02310 [archaeon]